MLFTSDSASVMASLRPGQDLTTAALERLLDLFRTASYRILDPFIVSECGNLAA
jgi:hypothetical protein